MLENYIQLSPGQQDLVETFCFINALKPGGDMTEEVQDVQQEQEQETFPVDFSNMVRTLFKTQGMHQYADGVMHAAIGISGEVGEIFEAHMEDVINMDNLKEEFGDLEFYMVALCQAADITEDNIGAYVEMLLMQNPGRQYSLVALIKHSSDLLDSAKRCWVYGKTIEEMRPKLLEGLAHLILATDQMYNAAGFKVEDIYYENQVKLIGKKGRFRNMVYSDAEARDRADKQEEGA